MLLMLPINASDGHPLTDQYSQSSSGLKILLESRNSFWADIRQPTAALISDHFHISYFCLLSSLLESVLFNATHRTENWPVYMK